MGWVETPPLLKTFTGKIEDTEKLDEEVSAWFSKGDKKSVIHTSSSIDGDIICIQIVYTEGYRQSDRSFDFG